MHGLSPSPHVHVSALFVSNRYVRMKPMISHVSLDKDFFSCLVLLVLKAGFPAHRRLVAWVQAVSVGDATTTGHQQNLTVLNLQAWDWPVLFL